MSLFIFTFFLIYGGAHFYAFLKIKKALLLGMAGSIPVIVFMSLMVAAPFVIRLAEKWGLEVSACALSYIGYTWMGLLLFFFSTSLVFDVIRIALHAGEAVFKKGLFYPSAKLSFFVALSVSLVAVTYGIFEAINIKPEKIVINTSALPEGLETLRIVQISDLHTGLINKGERLKGFLEEVKKTKPDMLVSTGDLVDGQVDSLMKCVGPFNEINPRFGKFAVTGNHEFYAGLEQALAFTEKAGFKVLRGEAVSTIINIAGVDDPQGKSFGLYKDVSEKALLETLPRDRFTLLLKHKPVVNKSSIGLFDLQLSGHTHRGQIFPFSLVVSLFYKYFSGDYTLSDVSSIHVSRGTGTWGPPMRLLSPPEITVIELIRK